MRHSKIPDNRPPIERLRAIVRGRIAMRRRMEQGKSQRECANELGITAVELNKFEGGIHGNSGGQRRDVVVARLEITEDEITAAMLRIWALCLKQTHSTESSWDELTANLGWVALDGLVQFVVFSGFRPPTPSSDQRTAAPPSQPTQRASSVGAEQS